MLALYDLCAVLTPCGPLKMLVGLMQDREDSLPGLLYEAQLPPTGPQQAGGQTEERIQIPAPTTLGVGLVGLLSLMTDSDNSNASSRSDKDVENHSPVNSRSGSLDGGSTHGLLNDTTETRAPKAPVMRRKKTSKKSSSEPSSIKLGLGDFVFYSVLVSRAAVHGFSTCIACGLVILGGLGITLVLLAVFQKALPALPVSIFLGVLFYLCTRVFIVPLLEESSGLPIYF